MTLDEIKTADQTVKDDIGLKMYQKLVSLYLDQYGSDSKLPESKNK